MTLDKSKLNAAFALAKDNKTGHWCVGQWVNQTLWTVDGSSKRLCSFKEMTRWRYFRSSWEHVSEVPLEAGHRVLVVKGKKEVGDWCYVISALPTEAGKFCYLVGQ